jgi:DNA polymerase-1
MILKIYGIDLFHKKFFDTWIASQVLNYRRPHKHGLSGWGGALNYPKFDFNDWSGFSDEMMTYCVRDVQLNAVVFTHLMKEMDQLKAKQPLISEGLKSEMEAAKFDAYCRYYGWKFDEAKGKEVLSNIISKMTVIEKTVEPNLPPVTRYIDKVAKLPKFTKKGEFTATTTRMLGEFLKIEIKPTDTHLWAADKEYQRKITVKANLGNMEQVKEYLYSIGWKPDDWKMERSGHGWVKKSPKLTSTSLEKVGEHGKLIDEWTTLRSRKGILEGWFRELVDGRLHGRLWVVGTPTFRCRHEVIANLPAATAAYGKELRSLLTAEEGRKIVGADSSGNQFRSLAHYVNSDDLTNQILSGDIHQYNADIIKTDRRTAKTWIYAFLFGAGATKLGQVLTGVSSLKAGKESMERYGNAIPGLKILKEKIESIWSATSNQGPEGYVPGLDGRKVYTPQPYQTLNYLLQSCEAITTKSAVAYQIDKIREENLDAQPRLYYHDEVAWSVADKDADRVLEILIKSFAEGPKSVGVTIMNGEGSIGSNYAEVH